ncbi:MAG: phage terminase large subunit family protein [Candidatus Diapherotrites archaeon]|nr:phage terminase large subunit family protein [Candidatus Diapherotrites archaeon]
MTDYLAQAEELIESAGYLLSNEKPSEWAENNRVMTSEVSPFPGPFRFSRTPYLREVLDRMSPNDPAHTIVTMKGAQIGFSVGVIENAIGYIIAQSPGNILLLTGHSELSEESVEKVDHMIDGAGLRHLIRSSIQRKKNQKTGDTNKGKEFPGGSLVSGSAGNHKLLRQRSVRYGFIDDFDAAKQSTKESGSTREMIDQRFAAYADKRKVNYISTPEVKQTSNIEPAYLLGDQRKYFVPCPCCGVMIVLHWKIDIDGESYGITYQRDENGELVEGSVGYTCQECHEFFTDAHKYEMNLAGEWRATATPSEPGYYSYHISSLYAPPGMYDWEHYVRQYIKANPLNAPQKTKKMQTFVNLVLGETFEELGEVPKANALQKNIRSYDIGIVPEQLSIKDGNGSIVLLTCAADLNGLMDDARLDFEIVAWSEAGPSYSVKHGSIGTFIPNQTPQQKEKDDRLRWTYNVDEENNVWNVFEEIIGSEIPRDQGKPMKILLTGIDTGNVYGNTPFTFISQTNNFVIAVKGKDPDKHRKFNADTPTFKKSRKRSDLYLVDINQVKDDLAVSMRNKWKEGSEKQQPSDFMNFPTPSGGLYLFNNFFAHYESEHRVIEKDKDGEGISALWVKVAQNAQNHLWDCRVYNIGLRDIVVSLICKEYGLKDFGWNDYVEIATGQKKS